MGLQQDRCMKSGSGGAGAGGEEAQRNNREKALPCETVVRGVLHVRRARVM